MYAASTYQMIPFPVAQPQQKQQQYDLVGVIYAVCISRLAHLDCSVCSRV